MQTRDCIYVSRKFTILYVALKCTFAQKIHIQKIHVLVLRSFNIFCDCLFMHNYSMSLEITLEVTL